MTNPARAIINYTCPNSTYTLLGTTCTNTVCDEGYTETSTGTCAMNVPARTTIAATYIPRCPEGYIEESNMCYKECDPGSSRVMLTKCRLSPIQITSAAVTVIKSPLNPCDDTDDLVDLTCVTKCDPMAEKEDTTTCTPNTIPAIIAYNLNQCNDNETLKNGVCLSNCPEGKYPDGELCVGQQKVVSTPSTITCTSSPFGSAKKWLCNTQKEADALMKDPSPTTTYVSPEDQVCIADDPTTLMYFCQSGEDAKNNTGYVDDVRQGYYSTCDNLTKNYTDLSNNVLSLKGIKDGLIQGTAQLGGVKDTLNNIYLKLNCATTPTEQNAPICQQIQNGSNTIGSNSTDINNTLLSIIDNIQKAFDLQANTLISLKRYNCPAGV
jgi:hypothetical protein